ncbi:MAG TPA: MarR family transcriptional regulator [Roseiflexaceae bacterium]|nr:MarR family transcriptional regulator [Roseiflexaceae bacterium]
MNERVTTAQITAWRLFITAHATLIEQIDRELAAAGCIPLQWYDVLVELFEAPERRLRMAELARRVVLSRSSLTHLADRLEREGLLARERVHTDRRGAYAVLTAQGEQALRAAWPIYARGIAQHFVRHLTHGDIQILTDVFQRLLTAEAPAEA